MADRKDDAGPSERRRNSAGRVPPSRRAATDQGGRILAAAVDVIARDGYLRARIGDIASCARVSRATFYEYFTGKEECFLAAHSHFGRHLGAEVLDASHRAEPDARVVAFLDALISFAHRSPEVFSLLTHEALVAGPTAFVQREKLIDHLAGELERAWTSLTDPRSAPDIPAPLVLRGVIRMVGYRNRRGDDAGPTLLLGDILAWIDLYATDEPIKRWRRVSLTPTFAVTEAASSLSLTPALPRGRHRLAAPVVARIHNERLVRATVDVIADKGYASATVADIVASAGVSRDTFYTHFSDKRDAYLAAYKQGFEHTLAAALGAFFTSTGDWRSRVWESGKAFTTFLASEPKLAYLGFVEAYALGPADAVHVDNAQLGFAFVLEDGYRYRPPAAQVPRLACEAITGAIAETAATLLRNDQAEALPSQLPLIAYTIMAPFTGPSEANTFIDTKLGSEATRSRPLE